MRPPGAPEISGQRKDFALPGVFYREWSSCVAQVVRFLQYTIAFGGTDQNLAESRSGVNGLLLPVLMKTDKIGYGARTVAVIAEYRD